MTVLTPAEMAQRLNIRGADAEAEIEATITEAQAHIERRVGPLEPTEVTALASVNAAGVGTVPVWPILSLTSGADASGADVDVTGVVVRPGGVLTSCPSSLHSVTYQAGRTTCPDDLRAALSELVRHLWQSRRPASGPGTPPDGQAPGYLLPYRVATLLEPHLLPGFA